MKLATILLLVLSSCIIPGKQGPRGPAGLVGVQGPKGEPGDSFFNIKQTIACNGMVLDKELGLKADYKIQIFTNNIEFVAASIRNAGAQVSATELWSPKQKGQTDSYISLVLDVVPPANYGWWSLQLHKYKEKWYVKISYHDDDIESKKHIQYYAIDKCIVKSYS